MFLNIDKHIPDSFAALDSSGDAITYGELCNFCSKSRGVIPRRCVIFLLCENVVASLAIYLSCVENNVVPLLLNASMDKALLQKLMETYEPVYVWLPKRKADDYLDCSIAYSYRDFVLVKTQYNEYEAHKDIALLMTTSGSTGSPKLVKCTRGNLEANAKNVARVFGWTKAERPMCDLHMSFTMGLNVINTHLYVGATLLLTTFTLMNAAFWRYMKEQRATNFTGVPFSYDILMKLRFTRMDMPHLTTIAQGAGKLTDAMFKELAEFAHRTGRRFFATFGTTETAARLAYLPPTLALTKIGSIGKSIPEGELFLIDTEGAVIAGAEAEGELGYRGPNVTMGYAACKAELLNGDEFHGVYHTGDVARRDADGYYYIIGRKARFLKLLGYRVSMDQCESLIKTEFNVDCACTGTDQKMLIYVVSSVDMERIVSFISEKTGIYKTMFECRPIVRLPVSDFGKVKYGELPAE